MANSVPCSAGVQASCVRSTDVSPTSDLRNGETSDRCVFAGAVPTEGQLLEGQRAPDHMHLCLRIAPKYSVSHTVGFVKGKSVGRIHRDLSRRRRMTRLRFWAMGYCVSMVGLDEYAESSAHSRTGEAEKPVKENSI